jgi:uncharacterized protein YkwD
MKILLTIAIAALVSGCANMAPPILTADFGPETLTLINSYRTSRGLPALTSQGTLRAMAKQHSQYQAARRSLGHSGFSQRSAQARAVVGGSRCVENVGYNYRDARQLFAGWRYSARHNKNMLQPYIRYAGVSVTGGYATFFACG